MNKLLNSSQLDLHVFKESFINIEKFFSSEFFAGIQWNFEKIITYFFQEILLLRFELGLNNIINWEINISMSPQNNYFCFYNVRMSLSGNFPFEKNITRKNKENPFNAVRICIFWTNKSLN